MRLVHRDQIRDNLLLGGNPPLEPRWVSDPEPDPPVTCLYCARKMVPEPDEYWCSQSCHDAFMGELAKSGQRRAA